MPLGDFRSVFMPYIIQKQTDGRYVVLNREYKPVGFYTRDFVTYAEHPVLVKFKGLTKLRASKISYEGDENTDRIVLYNDGCVPTHSKKNMQAYLARLEILAGLQVVG
jgi:hypothetical protein